MKWGEVEQLIEHLGIPFSYEKLRSDGRRPDLVHHRNRLIAYLREVKGLSYPRIGKIVNRDHSTVMHSMKSVKADREKMRYVLYGKITAFLEESRN